MGPKEAAIRAMAGYRFAKAELERALSALLYAESLASFPPDELILARMGAEKALAGMKYPGFLPY